MSAHNLLRALAVVVALPVLAGCSTDPTDRARLAQLRGLGQPQTPTLAPGFVAARAAEAPMVAAAVESQPEKIAIFLRQAVSETDGIDTWIGPSGAQLIFDRGVLVGTRGFGGDVLASDVTQSASLVQAMREGYATRLMTLIDGDDRAVTEGFNCKITRNRTDSVTIGTRSIATRTMVEDCRGAGLAFENYYWVVPGSGEIVQSSQWAGRVTGKISLRKAVQP